MSAEQNINPSHEKDSFETGLLPGYTRVIHSLEPVYDRNSRILILGSFPSVRSREQDFYYGHPQNRFWWNAFWRNLSLLTINPGRASCS